VRAPCDELRRGSAGAVWHATSARSAVCLQPHGPLAGATRACTHVRRLSLTCLPLFRFPSGPDNLANLKRIAAQFQGQQSGGAAGGAGGDDDVPEVDTFEG
jgi:hypothetical protein